MRTQREGGRPSAGQDESSHQNPTCWHLFSVYDILLQQPEPSKGPDRQSSSFRDQEQRLLTPEYCLQFPASLQNYVNKVTVSFGKEGAPPSCHSTAHVALPAVQPLPAL